MASPVMAPTDTSTSQHILNNNNIPTVSPSLPTLNSSSLISDNNITWNNAIVPATGTHFDTLNLFTPPAVDEKVLLKAQRLEYIDLDTILPQSAVSPDVFSFEIQFSQDNNINTLPQPKPQKQKISDFSTWMMAWNLYTQATLFHHPHKAYDLFMYQKEFCYLIYRFKFDACYNYDKAQRKQLASQLKLPTHQQTVAWAKRNDELYNIFLCDPSSHLPSCYFCHRSGHYASSCPSRSSVQGPSTINTIQNINTPLPSSAINKGQNINTPIQFYLLQIQ